MRKSQITGFLLLLFYTGKFIFCQKIHIWKTQFVLLHLHYRFFAQQVIRNAVTPTPMQIFIGFVDAILRSKILSNRLGILTQILIAMDYFFYLYISDKYLQFREKNIDLDNQFHYKKYNERDRNISQMFVFIFHHSIQHKASGFTFYKEKKSIFQGIFLVHPVHRTSNRIYLLRNYFQTIIVRKGFKPLVFKAPTP